jgi:hypothetical protein
MRRINRAIAAAAAAVLFKVVVAEKNNITVQGVYCAVIENKYDVLRGIKTRFKDGGRC